MHTVETDLELGFIRVRLESVVTLHDALEVVQKIMLQIEMLNGRCFSILLDFRHADPLPSEVAQIWVEVARQARGMGLVKSARLLRSQSMQAVVNQVARQADNVELVRNFTDEGEAIHWLTHATSRRLVT